MDFTDQPVSYNSDNLENAATFFTNMTKKAIYDFEATNKITKMKFSIIAYSTGS